MRIFRRSLWDERMTLLVWALVLVSLVLLMVSVFETYSESVALNELLAGLPEWLQVMFGGLDLGTVDGFLNSELFSWLPLLAAFYTGLYAASALAREVDTHTLESLLAQPVRRWSVVLQKFGTMLVGNLLLHAVVLGSVVLTVPLFTSQTPSSGAYVLVVTASFLTALAAGSLALLISAAVNEQRKATVLAAGMVMLLYFVNVIGQLTDKVRFLSTLNPFGRYHSAEIIRSGSLAGADIAFLVGFTTFFLAAAVWWFERKDLT